VTNLRPAAGPFLGPGPTLPLHFCRPMGVGGGWHRVLPPGCWRFARPALDLPRTVLLSRGTPGGRGGRLGAGPGRMPLGSAGG